MNSQQAFDQALQHHMAGRLPQAENLYRQILGQDPNFVHATHLLGLLAHQAGRSDIAVDLIRGAIALGLNTPDAYGNLGNALRGTGRMDEAIAALRQSLTLGPGQAPTYVNLGNTLQSNGQVDEAIAAFRQAIDIAPTLAEAHNNLASALVTLGQLDEAIASAERAIALRSDYSDACINLGNAYRFKGNFDGAIAAYSNALGHPPAGPNPNLAKVHSSLGSAYKDLGQVDQALTAYRKAAELDPADPRHGNNVLLLLQYHPGYDAAAIAKENDQWNRQYALPFARATPVHANDREPNRRLRIGYVSPDFKDHAVGRNLLPLFRNHDRSNFEIVCYSNDPGSDPITEEYRRLADSFINISHLSDDQAAVKIHHDRIDILIDLALHTANNRLLIFARGPAPVQATFAGYPAGTGLTAIDYRLSDPYLDPQGMDESASSEKTIRLENSFWCYDPLDCGDIAVNPLPALSSGVITFGCLNNYCKINDQVLALWAQVLRRLPNSRLLLLSRSGQPYPRTLELLANGGITADRIDFVRNGNRREYLQAYHRIDIGLDTFPYNGHTTSLDSLWMGVPVVTLAGSRSVARAGWAQLSNLQLAELAGQSPDHFVDIAAQLAGDLPRLSIIRSGLRARMEQSPLMDAPRFAQSIQQAYRQMWQAWCEQRQSRIG
jgi:predicted O-linked N-acetylglucosamine transferase (SPINDLY family)